MLLQEFRERKFLIAGVVREGFSEEVGFELSLGVWGGFAKMKMKGADTDVENGLEDMGRGKGKLGRSGRVAWTYIHYQM